MRFFKDNERQCKCCGEVVSNPVLEEMIDNARKLAGIPFVVTSWYRCENHNEAVGGSPTSSHVTGKAIDIKYKNSVDLFKIVKALMGAGFTRIGINYNKKFVHCDIDMDKIQDVIFTY
jgi:uncharacterized protein YcbK (DUF882 family)